jgi:alginate O-acetyltransferase complex protein AlgI
VLFCSEQFFVFFVAVFAVYWALPWHRARVWWLLAASFTFYASWNHWLALIVGASAGFDYFVGRALDATARPRLRKLLVGASVAANLGLLCYFKYANFFLQSVEGALRAAGNTASLPVLKVILPIGISFYTFEAINYTVDVYRRRVPAERNFGHFLLFILFFPHLIAGPIVRARDFLPQVRRPKRWDWVRLHLGARYFLLGLFKKMVIADRMAQFADPVYADPAAYGTGAAWVAIVAYALQVYGDFSGYSDMALGTAHMLGYKLAVNFDRPYLATSVGDYWRRWHISLSSWLRDYLFIPLGGSRRGRWKTARNLLITMTLCGLWHGASWMYVVFGAIHGVLLSVEREFHAWCERQPRLKWVLETPPGTAVRIAATFVTICVGLVVFRATSFTAVGLLWQHLFTAHRGLGCPTEVATFWWLAAATLVCHGVGWPGPGRSLAARVPAPVLGAGYAAALLLTLLLTPDGSNKVFIYFQF